MTLPKKNYAFVDGSYDNVHKVYSWGGILYDQYGKEHKFKGIDQDPELLKMRNVAGEIMGAMYAINLAIELGMTALKIFHDYEGVGNWPTGKWKCRKTPTCRYKEFVKRAIKNGLYVTFEHVKGHAGIQLNEEADWLAKSAIMEFLAGKE